MLIYVYFSKLNKQVKNTATFSEGVVRFGWTPPSHISEIFSSQNNCFLSHYSFLNFTIQNLRSKNVWLQNYK